MTRKATAKSLLRQMLDESASASVESRVALYNEVQRALGELVADFAPDPACSPRLIAVDAIDGNDYNPNKVASRELDLLEQSMRADGVTMALVVVLAPDGRAVVVDGFHRRSVGADRLRRPYLPCAVIDRPLADRMASTVRHNRARGKHQVDLMADLVKGMMALGWDDERVADAIGMSVEESLRLRQMVGAARLLANEDYSREWSVVREDRPLTTDTETGMNARSEDADSEPNG